ncbi:MAG TPA: PEP-CTERM sorting domain-containing protein [Acetobacteraceae bacterium]|nr:PEP-CTERM sorting domain-containing protein [Acetobacteraceae bacterium]
MRAGLVVSAAIVSAAAAVGFSRAGQANPIGFQQTYSLNYDGCSGAGCGSGPFGSVTLTQVSKIEVSLDVTLSDTQQNVTSIAFSGTGAGDALEFNGPAGLSIQLSSAAIADGFEVGPSPDKGSTLGNFDYSVTCYVKPNKTSPCLGASRTLPGPLDFTTTDGAALNVSDFGTNSSGYYFSSDVAVTFTDGSIATGNVGAAGSSSIVLSSSSPVPEPGSVGLLVLGLLGVMAVRYRRA